MLNTGKIIFFVAISLLTTISLATTCAPSDANCQLNQKKLQLMNEAGVTPIKTKDRSMPDTNKKASKPPPFQIPVPKSSQENTAQVQDDSDLGVPATVVDQSLQEQEQKAIPKAQQPVLKQPVIPPPRPSPQLQTQTGIYR